MTHSLFCPAATVDAQQIHTYATAHYGRDAPQLNDIQNYILAAAFTQQFCQTFKVMTEITVNRDGYPLVEGPVDTINFAICTIHNMPAVSGDMAVIQVQRMWEQLGVKKSFCQGCHGIVGEGRFKEHVEQNPECGNKYANVTYSIPELNGAAIQPYAGELFLDDDEDDEDDEPEDDQDDEDDEEDDNPFLAVEPIELEPEPEVDLTEIVANATITTVQGFDHNSTQYPPIETADGRYLAWHAPTLQYLETDRP